MRGAITSSLVVLGVLSAAALAAVYALGRVDANLRALEAEREREAALEAEQEAERVLEAERRRVSAEQLRADVARTEDIERQRRKLLGG